MQFTILGSGTMKSGIGRNPAGYLFRHSGRFALMDCGPGIRRQCLALNLDLSELDMILISHFHLDHCADVFPILMHRFLIEKTCNRNLTLCGPPGLRNRYDTMAALQGDWLNNNPPNIREWDGSPFRWHNTDIQACRTEHTESSIAYLWNTPLRLFYSSDTGYDEPLITFMKGVDIAVLECSLPDALARPGHLAPTEVSVMAEQAEAKRLIATHIYPENDTPDLPGQLSRLYSGPVDVAQDFMTIPLDSVSAL